VISSEDAFARPSSTAKTSPEPLKKLFRVALVADGTNKETGKQYRSSRHWLKAIRRYAAWEVQQFCIAQQLAEATVVNVEDSNLVVINWDSVNGDAACQADVSLQFFQTNGPVRIRELLSKGGILFAEHQGIKGVPAQPPYDALFGANQVRVVTSATSSNSHVDTATLFKKYRHHPLIHNLPSTIIACPDDPNEELFSMHFTGSEEHDGPPLQRYQRSLGFGWFAWWGKDWIPLLCAKLTAEQSRFFRTKHAPMLLARVSGSGLMIASTMWVAKAGLDQLIDNIFAADMTAIRHYHKKARDRRRINDATLLLAILVILVGVGYGLIALYSIPKPTLATHWAQLLMSAIGVGVATFTTIALGAFQVLRRRPLGLNVVDALRSQLHRRFAL
jgi:hypothetical protein